jgi:hypothetical protein
MYGNGRHIRRLAHLYLQQWCDHCLILLCCDVTDFRAQRKDLLLHLLASLQLLQAMYLCLHLLH